MNRPVTFRQIVFLLILVFFLTLSAPVPAAESPRGSSQSTIALSGRVMKVSDGDTVVVSPAQGGQFIKCRLYGIDAPEIQHEHKPGQPYGEESERDLKKLILGRDVEVEIRDKDKYGREVCVIRKDGKDMNLEMIRRGAAWAYRKYLKAPYEAEYIDAERVAKEKMLGFWKHGIPQPPWEFRKGQRGN